MSAVPNDLGEYLGSDTCTCTCACVLHIHLWGRAGVPGSAIESKRTAMHRYTMHTMAVHMHCTCIAHALHCSVTESKNPSRQMTVARGQCLAASVVRPETAAIPAVVTLRRAASHECGDAFAEVDAARSALTP